ncbi:helix-turn-helix domain-containing protein [Halonatronum saccharophilum]|uniref:helix-turn-helix domain-containing protein n=1 Tax=Halonatronum saccharophilum TaxID=150060 RepID=UPI0004BAEA8D|nr:helix-turn-helix domain-containing protein [Halonatronum saccharophilum]
MFNASKFRSLIEQARGDRSNSEYARESNVSRTYISQAINESLEKPPSPEILKNLANVAQNNVTYEQLMDAAGYLAGINSNKKKPEDDIRQALSDEPELLEFFDEMTKRDDLQMFAKQCSQLSPNTIKRLMKISKIFEEEERERYGG